MMIMDMIKMVRIDRQLVQLLSNCFCFFCGSIPILYSGMFLSSFIISFLQCQTKALVKLQKRGTDYATF